jgi:hypothetical protein
MKVEIREAVTDAQIRAFVRFPHNLYKNCKQYVPVFDNGEIHSLTKSPSLEYCQIKLWLAYSERNEIIGRIAGIYNPKANEYQSNKRVRFGWFDFINNFEVASSLLSKVEKWGISLGMTEIHGPLGYNTWYRQGILIEGFENTPPSNCLYNFPYYGEMLERLGYGKQLDWIQIKLEANVGVPDKLRRINEMLLEKHKLRIVDVEKFKKNKKMLFDFFESYNTSFRNIPNFVPLNNAEVEEIGREYMSLLKDELTCLILDENDKIAAFAVCFPSLSEAMKKAKGKMFPFGWYHILKSFRKYDSIDLMIMGAAKEWQNTGISSVLHTYLATRFKELDLKYAVTNPQAEENTVFKVWERYDYAPYMKRRCYIKNL